MKRKTKPAPVEPETKQTYDTNGPVPRASGNGHVRPLIDDENDHESRQNGASSSEWGSLFDALD